MPPDPDRDPDYARQMELTKRDIAAIPGALARGETKGDCLGSPPGDGAPPTGRTPLRKLKRPPDGVDR